MNVLKYLLVGFVFGIVLTKSEAVSWYRIYEMFQFQSFHMYGIIAVAILTGVIGIQIIKRNKLKDVKGQPIEIQDKDDTYLIKVSNVIDKNQISPFEYIKPTLKEVLLNKRKLELIKKFEKDITDDAIKNNDYEIYH